MNTSKKITTFLCLFTFTLSSWAQQSCPLTNSKLTDLRSAASKLATTIVLSSQCKTYEKTVNDANSELQKIATEMQAQNDSTDSTTLALSAITKLNTVNSVLNNDRCGQELAGILDYADAFIDVAMGMAPFLALYGGPAAMPWVLGSALGGASVKSLISFFNNKTIDMRNPEQSNAFIKNSCSFYNLDLIKNSIDDLQLRQSPQLQLELERSLMAQARINAETPEKPKNEISARLKQARHDEEKINFLQDQFKFDPLEACVYINAFASERDSNQRGSLIERIWENYEKTYPEMTFRLELEKDYFFNQLNEQAIAMDALRCNQVGLRWLNKISSLSQDGTQDLQMKLAKKPESLAYEKWQNQKNDIDQNVKVLEVKLGFFEEMTKNGFNIEYSEIIRSHRQVQDALFDSNRYLLLLKMRGLSEAWLRVKRDDAQSEYKDFKTRRTAVNRRINTLEKTIGKNLSHKSVENFSQEFFRQNQRQHHQAHRNVLIDVCNQLRLTWNAWYNGLIHAQAGRDYCMTFDKVINKLDYPEVQNLCFGINNRSGRRIRSLKNLVTDFQSIRTEADAVVAKMQELSCQTRGQEFDHGILVLPVY